MSNEILGNQKGGFVKGQAVAGALIVVLVAIGVTLFLFEQIQGPRAIQRQIEEIKEVTKNLAEETAKDPFKFPAESKVVQFGCSSAVIPSCDAEVDVASIEEFEEAIKEIAQLISDRGYDPCKIALGVSVAEEDQWTFTESPWKIMGCK